MDDTSKRFETFEKLLAALRSDVDTIKAQVPYLATKTDLAELRAELRGDMHSLETRIVKWMIGIIVTTSTLAFTIAKFVS